MLRETPSLPLRLQEDTGRLQANTRHPAARESPNTNGVDAAGGRQSSELFWETDVSSALDLNLGPC